MPLVLVKSEYILSQALFNQRPVIQMFAAILDRHRGMQQSPVTISTVHKVGRSSVSSYYV
jgi:hypothetical protein